MGTENPLLEKTISFAIRIVKCFQYLQNEKNEYVMSKQLLRSGTSIGANVHEAIFGQSRADFEHAVLGKRRPRDIRKALP